MSDYKPGTVAAIRDSKSEPEWRAVKDDKGWSSLDPSIGWVPDFDVIDARPLVVLDIDAPDFVARALRVAAGAIDNGRDGYEAEAAIIRSAADQIEAQTRPPKPPEPQGLGAVVEDTEGVLWVRSSLDGEDNLGKPWKNGPVCKHWQIVDAVRVLSDGWEPKP